jgi:hypothetical protein
MAGPCGGAGAGQRPTAPEKSRGRGPGSATSAKGASFSKAFVKGFLIFMPILVTR